MKTDIGNWLNNLNNLQNGCLLIFVGIIYSFLAKYFHKAWKGEGYKPFRPFRREGKTQSEDNFFIIMYMRTLLGIYGGYIIILFGILKILSHFKIINF